MRFKSKGGEIRMAKGDDLMAVEAWINRNSPTRRELAAMMAMQGLIASNSIDLSKDVAMQEICEYSAHIADALLKRLEK